MLQKFTFEGFQLRKQLDRSEKQKAPGYNINLNHMAAEEPDELKGKRRDVQMDRQTRDLLRDGWVSLALRCARSRRVTHFPPLLFPQSYEPWEWGFNATAAAAADERLAAKSDAVGAGGAGTVRGRHTVHRHWGV